MCGKAIIGVKPDSEARGFVGSFFVCASGGFWGVSNFRYWF